MDLNIDIEQLEKLIKEFEEQYDLYSTKVNNIDISIKKFIETVEKD